MKKFSSKRALLLSVISMVICVSMLIGSTFAWFTDSATANVNTIKSGDLDVEIVKADGSELTDALKWVAKDGRAQDKILWEPGCEYNLESFKIKNAGDLALKYKVVISGLTGDATLLEAIDFTVKVGDAAPVALEGWDGKLLPAGAEKTEITQDADIGETALITITGTMKTTAGNDYRGLSLEGISITVYATQLAHEFDSNGNTYDDDAGKDTAYYTLSEFNALTEIPEGIKNVYLNIGEVSLKDGGVTIGNKSMADIYTSVTGDYSVGQKLDDGRVVTRVWNESQNIYLANSNKAGINLYISGSVNKNNDYGLNNIGNGPFPNSLNFVIPDASNIVFTKDFTVNGYFRCGFSWNDNQTLGGGVASHKVQSVLFDHSTFNGIWIQNGGFNADSLTLDGCTFNAYENKISANDSNPLWFCNIGSCDVTITNCTFKASRPIKVVEQGVNGANVTITNNKFDMSLTNSANDASKPKNDAIMFSTITNTSTLGNVVVSGNEVTGANALLTFFNPSQITMADGATFTVSDNTLNGTKLSVEWKTDTDYKPDFVN